MHRKNAVLPVIMLLGLLTLAASVRTAHAQTNKTPTLGTAAWFTDRYDPQTWAVVNGFQGRNGVIQIGVDPSGAAANRPAPYSSSFYNWQGKKTAVDPVGTTPSPFQLISMDLWLDPSWANTGQPGETNSTAMWTRVNQVNSDNESTAWYPIVGFLDNNGIGQARYWDSNLGWQTMTGATLNYGAWNTFAIGYQNDIFTAYVNGEPLYTETANPGTVRLTDVFLEDHNLDQGFNAYWSNTPANATVTPEPASLMLVGTGIVGLAAAFKRRKKGSQAA